MLFMVYGRAVLAAALFFMSATAMADDSGEVVSTHVACDKKGIEIVVAGALVSFEEVQGNLADQIEAGHCVHPGHMFPVMLHSKTREFIDYEKDKMEIWRIVNFDGSKPSRPLFIWRRFLEPSTITPFRSIQEDGTDNWTL
jgi:hypothetical protein